MPAPDAVGRAAIRPRGVRVGLVCGDGLPVSGLLTVFRNAIQFARQIDVVSEPVPTELGYSWRPDKAAFFPDGPCDVRYPSWMRVLPIRMRPGLPTAEWAARLTSIRRQVARPEALTASEQRRLEQLIESLSCAYHQYFLGWLDAAGVDWVFCVNLTLSDAVPATRGFERAAAEHFGQRTGGRPGGVVYWDHDLFGTSAIEEPGWGRMYPRRPNAFTPLPAPGPRTRWIVVSPALAEEAGSYRTGAAPEVVSNALPTITAGRLDTRHLEFLRQRDLTVSRPIVLNPVRVFRVKGVHVAVELWNAIRDAAERRGTEVPCLLVFGSLQEERDYARDVVQRIERLGLGAHVRLLDGVPISTYREPSGLWMLDEIDLLRLAVASHGGVAFTPQTMEVETVGLGPALGALAGLPLIVTGYRAFEPTYGEGMAAIRLPDLGGAGLQRTAEAVLDVLARFAAGDDELDRVLRANREIVERRFPSRPWVDLWRELAT